MEANATIKETTPMTTPTTTEYAAQIRQTLKTRHGWTGRQVSVRADYFSMGSSISILVKDPAISLPTVKAIAEQAESISRDEITGEILNGGNRYVHVNYSREAQEIIGRRYADAVQRAVNAALDDGAAALEPIEGTPFLLGRPSQGRLSLWDRTRYLVDAFSVDVMAQTIGGLMVAREAA